ncbi:hypothetical protein V8G54_007836 [Vigna mungo]|uniref:Reverse transcriptase domain-containing protein n=1 Tax=Vigna mungo TaxID=3915 RepID=A0AAQ3S5U5_VIGMU
MGHRRQQRQATLEENDKVFQDLEGLPPSRHHGHSIHLQEGAAIPKLRPYKALNKVIIPNKFPLPVIKELLDELAGATMFSKEFLVTPFGLTNASATFQALMNHILQPFLRKFVLVFFDDILIYNPTLVAHVTHLTEVLRVLHQHKLKLNKKKCVFGQLHLEYLGHMISQQWVAADPKKVKAMEKILGLVGYYKRFVQGCGKIAKPLTQLLSKDGFHWTAEAQNALEALKKVVSQLPVLAQAVLIQKGRPLAFWSRALSERAQQKSVYEQELMAIVQAVRKCRLFYKGKLVLPKGSSNISTIIKEMHESLTGGHRDYFRMYKRIVAVLYWKAIAYTTQVWYDISMDFIGWLPKVQGKDTILVVVDRLRTHPRKWPQWLSLAEFWFNTYYSASTKMSPFEALYGCDPLVMLGIKRKPMQSTRLNGCKQINIRGTWSFKFCTCVYLKLQPYRLKSLAHKLNEKLSPRSYGPYTVKECIEVVAYKLDLPAYSRIHPVFHVSLLKCVVQPTTSVQPLAPALTEDLILEMYPKALLDVCTSTTAELEGLIKWKDLPSIENNWEAATTINTEFHAFHLEDKVKFHGGDIDWFRGKVYVRRNKDNKQL